MAAALVTSVTAGPGLNGGATSAIDTTGASLLVISASWWGAGGPTVSFSDSKGNTWIPLTLQASGTAQNMRHQFAYCFTPIVGSGHTFTVSGATTYPAIIVQAFSGMTGGSYETRVGTGGSVATSLATGSVTPTRNGALILTGYAVNNSTLPTGVTVSTSGFATTTKEGVGSTCFPGGMAYYVQPTAAAINPTWTWSSGTYETSVETAVFLPSPGIALVSSVAAAAATSAAIDTTGAALLVVSVGYWEPGGAVAVTDSKGNTWLAATLYGNTNAVRQRFYYCMNPTVGTGHTFSVTGQSSFVVQAFSTGGVSLYVSVQNGNTGTYSSSLTTGSVAHTLDDLIVTAFAGDGTGGADSPPAGFTSSGTSLMGNIESQAAYQIAGSTGSSNPSWTLSGLSHVYNVVSAVVFSVLPATITKIRTTGVATQSAVGSIGIGFSIAPMVGSGIVVMAHAWNPSAVFTASDNYGNTYETAIVRSTSNHRSAILFCPKVVTTGAGFTVTVASSGSTYFSVQAHEITGVGTALAAAVSAGATGSSTTPASGASATSPAANLFAVAVMGVQPAQSTITVDVVSPVWTQDNELLSNGGQAAAEFDSRALTGMAGSTLSAGWTNGTTGAWTAIVVGFSQIEDLPPSSGRVSGSLLEMVSIPLAEGRVTQSAVEMVLVPLATGNVTQYVVEMLGAVTGVASEDKGVWMGDGGGKVWID